MVRSAMVVGADCHYIALVIGPLGKGYDVMGFQVDFAAHCLKSWLPTQLAHASGPAQDCLANPRVSNPDMAIHLTLAGASDSLAEN